jgi:hypothetical protein
VDVQLRRISKSDVECSFVSLRRVSGCSVKTYK